MAVRDIGVTRISETENVPNCNEEHASREKTSFKGSDESADYNDHAPVLCERTAEDADTPGEREEGEPAGGTEFADDEVGWDFEDKIAGGC